ncbi:pathogenesis-related protein 5-like [Chrysoperla carnea]|uniref:pathogenesis-related protein 5-like n=1 Tax=Chrysoperla carnea TaxID=189513 RepID=UPI001D098605|nr:pathogenesis-related protein 5-like [Chrysoperla carnea]
MAMIKLLLVCGIFYTAYGREFQLLNNYGQQLWIGIQGNAGKGPLEGGGVVLNPGERLSTHSADDWAGRFWARTGCNGNNCETGDCGKGLKCGGNGGAPPVSLAEITLKGWGGIDYYDISNVDGTNIPISMEPLGGQGDGGQYSCKKSQCAHNFNDDCPNELRKEVNGRTVGCKSACTAFDTDEYCCRGAHDRPETCKSTDWPQNYPKFFKDRCPDAYSYAYDDHKSTFTCTAPAYLITFG